MNSLLMQNLIGMWGRRPIGQFANDLRLDLIGILSGKDKEPWGYKRCHPWPRLEEYPPLRSEKIYAPTRVIKNHRQVNPRQGFPLKSTPFSLSSVV